MEVWEQNWVPNHRGEAGEQRREQQEEGQAEEEGEEVVVGHHLRALEEVEEEKQRTSRGETEERVGRGRSWKVAEEAGGLQSQGEGEGLPCQRAGEVEEVQGEATGGDERWAGVRTWGEQGVGDLDSAH